MMIKREKIRWMIDQVESLIQNAQLTEEEYTAALRQVHFKHEQSAFNLIHYHALRMIDIRDLQKKLGNMGLSRLARAESHVMASLFASKAILEGFLSPNRIQIPTADLTIKQGQKLLKTNTEALLGPGTSTRSTRIMVTFPAHAADDPVFVENMIAAGMNCARINCAHEGPEEWKKMIQHVHDANKKLNTTCKIAMDLGGPKIRTGSMEPGPKILKLTPDRDIMGQVIQPVKLWVGNLPHATEDVPHLPIPVEPIYRLQPEENLYFEDTREKKRYIQITSVEKDGCWALCYDTAYLQTHTSLYTDPELETIFAEVGELPAIEQKIMLNQGDTLLIHREDRPGQPAQFDDQGQLTSEAHISCTATEVFTYVRPGDPVLFDDGKIEGIVRDVSHDELRIEITLTKTGGSKLRADKGINFPRTQLKIQGLTPKDREDLVFVAEYADVVNVSFVNEAEDVRELIKELEKLGASDRLGIILKIETQRGFNNLTSILLEAMRLHPVGVMIARGDLAIEIGWDHIARVQEEILSICLSGHIPVIWATQVLENLAKKGIPSRAEITDAAMSQRAECVMLNKGPMILRAIKLLDTILTGMQPYNEKNAPMLPALRKID